MLQREQGDVVKILLRRVLSSLMAKRTTQTGLPNWEDAEDINHLVKDKRTGKRGTPAKARRRNRRYENRILRSQIDDDELWKEEASTEDDELIQEEE